MHVSQKLFNKLRILEPGEKIKKEKKQMDNEVKPTWRLAWGLWWRMTLIGLGIGAIIMLIVTLVGLSLIPRFIPW